MNKLIWQPIAIYQPGHDFGVLVDREFVAEMLGSIIPEEAQRRMNELGIEALRGSHRGGPPYVFHGNTTFVRQFSFGNDTWLAVDECRGESPLEVFKEGPIKYSSHNVKNPRHALLLLGLVDLWVEYSDVLKTQTRKL